MSKSVFTDKYQRFREMLVESRQRRELTQIELAQRLGRPQSYVSKFERGERRLDVVEFMEVSQALGIDPLHFLRRLQRVSDTPKSSLQTVKGQRSSKSVEPPSKRKKQYPKLG